VKKTGTVGAIGGMGFISTLLCNVSFWYLLENFECRQLILFDHQFAGTNIGTTILLCRVIQAWVTIHNKDLTIITERTFWGTVYAMALGVNYGAFSTAFSASLAGLLWRDILGRKHIHVRRLDFARVNLPIIAIAMAVGCSTLIIQIYISRSNNSFDADLFKTNCSSSTT
jgi:hypothetical protein